MSCLLYLDGKIGNVVYMMFVDMLKFVELGDFLVFNNMWVIFVCLLGKKEMGG